MKTNKENNSADAKVKISTKLLAAIFLVVFLILTSVITSVIIVVMNKNSKLDSKVQPEEIKNLTKSEKPKKIRAKNKSMAKGAKQLVDHLQLVGYLPSKPNEVKDQELKKSKKIIVNKTPSTTKLG